MDYDSASPNPEAQKERLGATEVSALVDSSNPPRRKQTRPLHLLIGPIILVIATIALLVAMIIWLIVSQTHPFDPPASLTRGAFVVDEASRACKIKRKLIGSATCGSKPILLGLTLSGLLVRTHFALKALI